MKIQFTINEIFQSCDKLLLEEQKALLNVPHENSHFYQLFLYVMFIIKFSIIVQNVHLRLWSRTYLKFASQFKRLYLNINIILVLSQILSTSVLNTAVVSVKHIFKCILYNYFILQHNNLIAFLQPF